MSQDRSLLCTAVGEEEEVEGEGEQEGTAHLAVDKKSNDMLQNCILNCSDLSQH